MSKGGGPTADLQKWCAKMTEGYPGVSIDNFDKSWRNGLAFCALVHRHVPDALDFASLDPNNIQENNQLAFDKAFQHLNVPKLLDAEDMLMPKPERFSIMTYLLQFYKTVATHPVAKAGLSASLHQGAGSATQTPQANSPTPTTKVVVTGGLRPAGLVSSAAQSKGATQKEVNVESTTTSASTEPKQSMSQMLRAQRMAAPSNVHSSAKPLNQSQKQQEQRLAEQKMNEEREREREMERKRLELKNQNQPQQSPVQSSPSGPKLSKVQQMIADMAEKNKKYEPQVLVPVTKETPQPETKQSEPIKTETKQEPTSVVNEPVKPSEVSEDIVKTAETVVEEPIAEDEEDDIAMVISLKVLMKTYQKQCDSKQKDEDALKKAFEGVEKAHSAFQKIARASANASDDEEEKEMLIENLDGVAAAIDELLKGIQADQEIEDVQMAAYEVNSSIDEIRDIMFGGMDFDFGEDEDEEYISYGEEADEIIGELDTIIQGCQEDIAAQQEEIQALTSNNIELKEEVEILADQAVAHEEEINKLKEQLKNFVAGDASTNETAEKNEQLFIQIKELTTLTSNLQDDLVKEQQKVADLTQELQESNADLKTANTALHQAQELLEQGDSSVSTLRKNFEDTDKKRQEEVKAISNELNEERDKNIKLNSDLTKANVEKKELEASLKKSVEENQILKEETEGDNYKKQDEITGLKKQLKDANDAIADLQEGVKLKFQQRKAQDEENKKILDQYKQQQEDSAKELLENKNKLEESQKLIDALKAKLDAISEIIKK